MVLQLEFVPPGGIKQHQQHAIQIGAADAHRRIVSEGSAIAMALDYALNR